jgi:hypothetical protein
VQNRSAIQSSEDPSQARNFFREKNQTQGERSGRRSTKTAGPLRKNAAKEAQVWQPPPVKFLFRQRTNAQKTVKDDVLAEE